MKSSVLLYDVIFSFVIILCPLFFITLVGGVGNVTFDCVISPGRGVPGAAQRSSSIR